MDDVGLKLKLLRTTKKMKMKDVAEKANISQSGLSYIESGDTSPSISTLSAILAVYGVSLSDFFSNDASSLTPNVSPDDLELLNDIKNLSPDKREIVETVVKVDKAAKDNQAAAEGK